MIASAAGGGGVSNDQTMVEDRIERISTILGYHGDRGFIRADEFRYQRNHRHALRVASQEMAVVAAFGLWTGPEGTLHQNAPQRFTPLVYVAMATDAEHAQSIHRSVWSQGLAPYLLVVSSEKTWLCHGFSYSSGDWEVGGLEVQEGAWEGVARGERESPLFAVLARTLRSSVAWRDRARAPSEYVDERLLKSLANLAGFFSNHPGEQSVLGPAAINALVARMLYFYFLADRRFITEERLQHWGVRGVSLESDTEWTAEGTQVLFERLDEVFNGSIFPVPSDCVDKFRSYHINTIRRVLRNGETVTEHAGSQLSFVDYDFASIRTETLSAIYEMFLRSEESEARKKLGAFYTPPYLADYVLDRLEDAQVLSGETRVLDPSAGSGVFLVGAYRRIVEASLAPGETTLDLRSLHSLMTGSIFGVEVNRTACHVAAFSLYLTMLDYVEPVDAANFIGWPAETGQPRLFPPMLKSAVGRPNIVAADFFSSACDFIKCDVVVGNPPWVAWTDLPGEHAASYSARRKRSDVGGKQAAELFTWKALECHLAVGGVLSVLLPQKTMVNQVSEKFISALRAESEFVGIADLSHLRYKLFSRTALVNEEGGGARHGAALVISRNRRASPGSRFWVFRPLLSSQPVGKSERLWILVQDWTQVSWHTQADQDAHTWRRLFTCLPVDRRLLGQLDRQVSRGRIRSFAGFGDECGFKFVIETDMNIDRRYVLCSNPKERNYWEKHLGSRALLLGGQSDLVPLPPEQIDRSIPSIRPFLQGNVVLFPRTCAWALYVEQPVATKFMIVGCFPEFGGVPLPPARKVFLQAVAAYMSTASFRYLCFANSRRMSFDRLSIELTSVTELPCLFDSVDDSACGDFLRASEEEREGIVGRKFGWPESYQRVVREFEEFRKDFRDGKIPPGALSPASENQQQDYARTLLWELDGNKGRHVVETMVVDPEVSSAAVVRYVGGDSSNRAASQQMCVQEAVREYRSQGGGGITQCRYLWHSTERMVSVLIKPIERLQWTHERAFADADLITARIMAGANPSVSA